VRGRPRPGGVEKVFTNLCLGLDRLGIAYDVNLPFNKLRSDDCVGVLGRGRAALDGYDRPNSIVAGIGLMTHPAEWPSLCDEYPVVRYLQHSAWANDVYKPYFGDRCTVWPVGIDTEAWTPSAGTRDIDVLVYDKVHWHREQRQTTLLEPIRDALRRRGLRVVELRYGSYEERDYRALLGRSRAMIFLAEHESQGLAYQECLSSGVPILAWDQGWWLDPQRFQWRTPSVPATSVPYFDARCGATFADATSFDETLDDFLSRVRRGAFNPRGYVLEHLTLERCSRHFVELLSHDAARVSHLA
jgi:glycosyltransferase involved in cell wall biosynthesis